MLKYLLIGAIVGVVLAVIKLFTKDVSSTCKKTTGNCALCGQPISMNKYFIGKTSSGKTLWKCPDCARKGGFIKIVGENAVFCDKDGNPLDNQENKTENPIQTSNITQTSNTEELKKYKELLDSGIITQEEFDAKKKQLLGL